MNESPKPINNATTKSNAATIHPTRNPGSLNE